MTTVRVAVPLLKGKRRFYLEKGRPWSVVEHAILAALTFRSYTAGELAVEASLPRRLVIEAIIRLMRAGWIIVEGCGERTVFSASKAGIAIVDNEELPNAAKRVTRWMNFVIDKVTGTLYRTRELPYFDKHIVEQRAERERLVWLEPRETVVVDEAAVVVSTLLEDDEKFLSMAPAGDRLVDRYAIVSVRDGVVEGLPSRAPLELERLVLDAARDAPNRPEGKLSPSYRPEPAPAYTDREHPKTYKGVFQSGDLVLGGGEHKEAFIELLRRACRRIIIHSTFIAEDRFVAVRPLMYDAVKRGAQIDILWGEDEEKVGSATTKATVARLRQWVESNGLCPNFRIHAFSTRSHSKIAIADDGATGRMFALVGSCNWLSTDFHSFDASVRLRDPRVVAAVLDQVAELTRGADGHWTDLTNSTIRLAVETREQAIPSGPQAEMAIVLGPQHSQYVRKARDEATSRLFVTSHRLGSATRTAIVVPAISAVQDRGVDVKVYYGRTTGSIGNEEAARLTAAAQDDGVRIRPVREPRLHAKILGWDDDNLLITSQNWLSADPSEGNLRGEIGIFVNGHALARTVIDNFEAKRRE